MQRMHGSGAGGADDVGHDTRGSELEAARRKLEEKDELISILRAAVARALEERDASAEDQRRELDRAVAGPGGQDGALAEPRGAVAHAVADESGAQATSPAHQPSASLAARLATRITPWAGRAATRPSRRATGSAPSGSSSWRSSV